MVPEPVTIANITVGAIINAIKLCNALVDRYDVKQDVKESCGRLKQQLCSCREKASDLNKYISQYRNTKVWQDTVSEINDSLTSIESRLDELLDRKFGPSFLALPRRKFRQPYDMSEKLSALIGDVQQIDMKIYIFKMNNNVHTEAKATNIPHTDDDSASQLQESDVDRQPASAPNATPHDSRQHSSSIETPTAFTLASDAARFVKDLIVYSGRELIALGDWGLLRIQEALVARAVADFSECLRLLGNKNWYFCGSNTLPMFVVKMAFTDNPDAARRKIVDVLMSLSRFGKPTFNLHFQAKNMWDATTTVDVSFVNALIIKDRYRRRGSRAAGKARILNDINSELNISASDMLLVLQTMRRGFSSNIDLAILSNGEQGLGWYRVVFVAVDGPEQSSEVVSARLEYICTLEALAGGINSPTDIEDIMILNFLHTTEISPEARTLKERTGRKYSYMKTLLENEGNTYEEDKAIFDEFGVGGAYTELLEIACIYTLRAAYHARCKSYVGSLAETVDERQLVVSSAGRNRHMHIRDGREIAFGLLAEEFGRSVLKDAEEERKLPASCHDLYEYGRFCAQGEVRESWYDLLVPTVANKVNVNFAQAALTGRGSYTKFVAGNVSVCLRDSVVLCDPASDSIAVAFDGVSDLHKSLEFRISELVTTTESERLRAAFFICRGAVRTGKYLSTRMIDVMRSRYMGLDGVGSISAQDVVEELDEGESRNPAVLVECMESLAMQGGYRAESDERSLFAALCSKSKCEKTILVTGRWPPLFGRFHIRQEDASNMVKLEEYSEYSIVASRDGSIYRARDILVGASTLRFTLSHEVVCVR